MFYICQGSELRTKMRGSQRVLNMPNKHEYALPEYAFNFSICVNMSEFDWICQHILEKPECYICQNSECVWCRTQHKITVKFSEQLSRQRGIQNTVKHLRSSVLQKEQYLSSGGQSENFQGISCYLSFWKFLTFSFKNKSCF